jgi:hypothetical protein
VVIIGDVDRLTRNLPGWGRFETAAVGHRVLLSAYAGGDLDLSAPEGWYYGGHGEVAGQAGKARSRACGPARPMTGSRGRASRRGAGRGGSGTPGSTPIPGETSKRRRVVLREEVNQAEAGALRDAAARVLGGESAGSIIREWTRRGITPSRAAEVGGILAGQNAQVGACGRVAGVAGAHLPGAVARHLGSGHPRTAGPAVR